MFFTKHHQAALVQYPSRDDERKGEEDHGAYIEAEEDTPVMIGYAVEVAVISVAEEYHWERKNRDGKREDGIEEEDREIQLSSRGPRRPKLAIPVLPFHSLSYSDLIRLSPLSSLLAAAGPLSPSSSRSPRPRSRSPLSSSRSVLRPGRRRPSLHLPPPSSQAHTWSASLGLLAVLMTGGGFLLPGRSTMCASPDEEEQASTCSCLPAAPPRAVCVLLPSIQLLCPSSHLAAATIRLLCWLTEECRI
nr:unnamed protein product [Digitaria exilis]